LIRGDVVEIVGFEWAILCGPSPADSIVVESSVGPLILLKIENYYRGGFVERSGVRIPATSGSLRTFSTR